jgi:hypothetical protein
MMPTPMMNNKEIIKLKEVHNGFSERDIHSKAILSRDNDSLLKYKIQKNRMNSISSSAKEMESLKSEFISIKEELNEIRNLLLRITAGKQ